MYKKIRGLLGIMVKSTKRMKINIGPQHPSTHGVLRLVTELEGEVIKSCEPNVGYLHRGMEKMAESRTYLQYLPVVDRIDYLSGFFCSEAYCQAVEKLLDVEVPEYAQYVRVLLMELNRISSHLLWLGTFMLDLGATSPLFYCFREREVILGLFEELTGQRMMYNFHTFSGIKNSLTSDFLDKTQKFLKLLPQRIDEYEAIISQNPIFLKRTVNLGILTQKAALGHAVTGANLRATGISYDMRKVKPYLVYEKLDFKVPTRLRGDSYSRYLVRVEEMREAQSIAMQCIHWLRVNEPKLSDENVKARLVKPEAGMAVGTVEAPRGAMSCFVYSDGSSRPYRVKWRTGSFYAVQALPELVKNRALPDLMAIFGSLDVVLPEVDR